MAIKRTTTRYRRGEIVDVEEFHDGKYGAPGLPRKEKKKKTKEEMLKINLWNKARKCRQRLLEYFHPDDILATWTYRPEERPTDMQAALKDFQKAIRKVRGQYKKRGYELFWIRNIERGTRGAWHIHLVVNEIGDTASILQKAWSHGGTWSAQIRQGGHYDEDFTDLANYMTKSEHTREERKDGEPAKPRIKESSYNTSKNMPLPEPKVDKLKRWKKEPKPNKGYYIVRIYEGINPVTGYKYRRYTQIKFHRRI